MVSKLIDDLIKSKAEPVVAARPTAEPATRPTAKPVGERAVGQAGEPVAKSVGLFDNIKVLPEPPDQELLKQLTEDEVAHLDMFGVNCDAFLRSVIREQREMKEQEGKYPCSVCLGIAAKLGLLR